MIINHSSFNVSTFTSKMNALSYVCEADNYICHDKWISLRFHNFLLIGSITSKYYSIRLNKYWYTRI